MRGPGKYDAIATLARETARADGVVLIVMGGDQGDGSSVQVVGNTVSSAEVVAALRAVADVIGKDMGS